MDADYAELQRKMAIMNPESPGGDEESQAAALNREAQRIQAEAEKAQQPKVDPRQLEMMRLNDQVSFLTWAAVRYSNLRCFYSSTCTHARSKLNFERLLVSAVTSRR